ncbi:UbiH/UbiF/VisC/COQ6 family ubiquinone biosynthesis hydroxylase [Glaciimonas sp. Gout2]|uniref:UbiH/UbiF/VisC/COQ6 family ubiquinone biosynthesis hydroxylase n=1 Tax=unclassified Glaciimonas TaxID=2644401 RepID=UPI002B22B870|nr:MULTISPECIES: UbiH/UbiF/VisC/COQ6 family ubiquinone biosynthesis hydroxylase [unclassified Glaciimonas]MEB0011349.1 UbiH/UbiF/VisC/COQ6 family ubiquinone biosynthesis hydroxylase [Glaciimonas sp. Cout2]MEB0080999.1 UbiH/UbiF/VisC/COQ6 family ubiquinone biosynthesis hydroxylase [Glaciimonas sp. Gout2]
MTDNTHIPLHTDIAICGAGPVGVTLAALLIKRGVAPDRIALIDGKTIDQARLDPRAIALSYGSRQILEDVRAWPLAATAIHQIHVSRRGHFGRTLIERADYQIPALGYVCRYGDLITTLTALPELHGITLLRPVQVSASNEQSDGVTITLSDGRVLRSKIMVQAEGGLFGAQTNKELQRDYDQIAIVAHVQTSAPVPHRAFERFTDQGPLALLPQDDGYALVWCVRPDNAAKLLTLPDELFLKALENAFGGRVGHFIRMSSRNSFPLGLNAHPATSVHTVAIGNAAQTLHPVAGQGLNLGLRDAAVLAKLLAQEVSPLTLEKFSNSRKTDRSMTIHMTDLMARVFASAPQGALSQTLLGLSLGLVDAIKPAKNMLAEQMMFGRR